MCRVQEKAEPAPETAQRRFIPRRVLIKAQYSDDSEVHPIHHVGASPKVIQFLRQREIPRMEYRAERPTCQTAVTERKVVWPERVPRGDRLADSGHPLPMGKEIEDGEEDREDFLHAENPTEGPFAMELQDRREHWGISSESAIRHHMLTGIVAFGRTSP